MVYSTDRSKAVFPVLGLLFVALWFILRGDLFNCFFVCYFVLVFFCPLSIAIISLGEERGFKAKCFSYVCSICACLVLSVSFFSWSLGRQKITAVKSTLNPDDI